VETVSEVIQVGDRSLALTSHGAVEVYTEEEQPERHYADSDVMALQGEVARLAALAEGRPAEIVVFSQSSDDDAPLVPRKKVSHVRSFVARVQRTDVGTMTEPLFVAPPPPSPHEDAPPEPIVEDAAPPEVVPSSPSPDESASLRASATEVVSGNVFENAKSLNRDILRIAKAYGARDMDLPRELGANTDAYDAYITATGTDDESHFSFLKRLKESQKDLENHHSALFKLNVGSERMSTHIRQMADDYAKAQARIVELEGQDAEQAVAMQKELLAQIAAAPEEATVSAVSQLGKVQALKSSLELLAALGLCREAPRFAAQKQLLETILELEQTLTEKPVDPARIDAVTIQVQDFIGGVSPPPSREDTEPIKAELSKVRRNRDDLARQLKESKASESVLKQQVAHLAEKAATEKETGQRDVEVLRAQVAGLRQTLAAQKSEDVTSAMKEQVSQLHLMLDAAISERDVVRGQLDDAREEVKAVRAKLETVEIEVPARVAKQELFRDAEITRMREELAADAKVVALQRQELEAAVGQNRALTERCTGLDQQLIACRKELRQAETRADEALLARPRRAAAKTKLGLSPSICLSLRGPPPAGKVHATAAQLHVIVDVAVQAGGARALAISRSLSISLSRENSSQNLVGAGARVLFDQSSSGAGSPAQTPAPGRGSGAPTSPREGVGVVTSVASMPSDNEDTVGDLPDMTHFENFAFFMRDDIAQSVHAPLAVRPKKVKRIEEEQQQRIRPRVFKPRQRDIQTPDLDLSVNNAPQGKRTLTGTSCPIKPTVFGPPPRRSPLTDVLPPVDVIVPRLIQTPAPKVTRPLIREPMNIDRTLEESPVVPVRITLVKEVHLQPEEADEPLIMTSSTTPGFAPVPRRSTGPMAVHGDAIPPNEPSPEMKEASKIIHRLREQLRKSQERCEADELELGELRQKISELMLLIHRLRLDGIRQADELARSKIRFENVKQRLDLCFREVGVRDDAIARLKRELLLLRQEQEPIRASMLRLQNAERIRARLEREAEQRRKIALAAENALKGIAEGEARTHLDRLVEHQRTTISRIETQRKHWQEIERNHAMAVLGALSLLDSSQYKTVRGVLPVYSPFVGSRVSLLRALLSRSRERREMDDAEMRAITPLDPVTVAYDRGDTPIKDDGRGSIDLELETTGLSSERDSRGKSPNRVTPADDLAPSPEATDEDPVPERRDSI
jgi:hypothetical protein